MIFNDLEQLNNAYTIIGNQNVICYWLAQRSAHVSSTDLRVADDEYQC